MQSQLPKERSSASAISHFFYLYSAKSQLKALCTTEPTGPPEREGGATVARKNSMVGRNPEQIKIPEGRHLPMTSLGENVDTYKYLYM